MRKKGELANRLPEVLRHWFGPDAGKPGTRHKVEFRPTGDKLIMAPMGVDRTRLQVWAHYNRADIPKLLGAELKPSIWNQGFVPLPNHLILFVTLKKHDVGGARPQLASGNCPFVSGESPSTFH